MTPPVRWIFLHFYPFLLSYLPFCWRMIHDSHKHIEKFLFISFFFISNRRGKKYIQDIVSRKKADLIISTHFYPGYIADEMKRKGMLSIPAALVITDHAGHRIYVRKHHDLIFVPSKDAVEQFVKYGIKREQLRITGCPVSFKFGCRYTESDLCRFRRELTLKENRCYVMLCMGGWATGGMCAAAKSILQADKDFTLLVMTAHNAELFRRFA